MTESNYQLKYPGAEVDALLDKANNLPDSGYKLTESDKTEIVEAVIAAQPKLNGKVYDIDLAKASGWIPLVTLDDEVVSHINDSTLVVCLRCVSDYVYEQYVMSGCTLSNAPVGRYNDYAVYGGTVYPNSETSMSNQLCFYPPNKTDTSTSIGGGGMFRLDPSTKMYYFRPGSYYTRAGRWRLTLTW